MSWSSVIQVRDENPAFYSEKIRLIGKTMEGQMENKQDLLVFMDENNEKQTAYIDIISTENGMLTYKTIGGNIVHLPLFRVLKIKSRENKE